MTSEKQPRNNSTALGQDPDSASIYIAISLSSSAEPPKWKVFAFFVPV